jgi:hypothetical protein
MPEIRYKRLARARARRTFAAAFSSRVGLWLGPDHLLCVETTGYWEAYKRFYFRDIQAIIIRESQRRLIWNAVLTIPLVICLVGLLVSLTSRTLDPGVAIPWSLFAAVFLVPFVMNNLRGPACVTQLRTAVQTEDLPCLSRLRQTRRILERLRPLINAAQGGEVPPPNPVGPQTEVAAAVAPAPAAPVPPPPGAVPPVMEP